MTIYEIDAQIRELLDKMVDPDTGEVNDDTDALEALDALTMERNSKLENVACYYKNVSADAAAIKTEESALKKRRETLERKAERLKRYLSDNLNGQKFQSPRAVVTFRKTERVEIGNAALAIASLKSGGHEDALRFKEPEIDKAKVKQYLKDGMDIPGVTLETGLSPSIQ